MKMYKKLVIGCTAILLLCGSSTAENKDTSAWPCFNGAKQDNLSPDKGLLKSWPEGGPKLLWKYQKAGKGFATVTVADDMIFTAGDSKSKTTITALDMNGKELWQTVNGGAWTGSWPGARSTPVYNDGMVYQVSGGGRLAAFEAKTGKEVWFLSFKGENKGACGGWGYAESVTIDGNNLICMPGGKKVLCLALDKKTGKEIWATEGIGDAASYCSGAIVEYKGKRMFLTMSAKYAVGIDLKTGKLMWKFGYTTPYDVHATTPVFLDGLVYITSGYGTEDKCLKLNDALDTATEAWSHKLLDNHHGGVVMLNGNIYGASEKKWVCQDMKTGKALWTNAGVGKGSVTAADGMLYCMSEKGDVALVSLSPDGYKESGSFKFESEGGDPFWNHPVVIGGKLYLRHENDLFVYDVKNK